jgi:phage shock protein PspC (stress-responsive transcriptional regulator)
MLDKANKKIAGVCAGFARYLDCDVTLIRVVWLVVMLIAGVGLLAYLAAWILMPTDRALIARPLVQSDVSST